MDASLLVRKTDAKDKPVARRYTSCRGGEVAEVLSGAYEGSESGWQSVNRYCKPSDINRRSHGKKGQKNANIFRHSRESNGIHPIARYTLC